MDYEKLSLKKPKKQFLEIKNQRHSWNCRKEEESFKKKKDREIQSRKGGRKEGRKGGRKEGRKGGRKEGRKEGIFDNSEKSEGLKWRKKKRNK